MSWKSNCSLETLKKRAKKIAAIRNFFAQRDVLEVQTPMFSEASVTDLHLSTFNTRWRHAPNSREQTLYLQTSPEFYMKRLLASGSGCIYQLNQSFRNEEVGRYHQPEFLMLEWYRLGFNHHDLMDEMSELLQEILMCASEERVTYQTIFQRHLNCDPLTASLEELKAVAIKEGLEDIAAHEQDKTTLLQLLFSMCVEPKIGQNQPIFVYDFPAEQAALAKISLKDPRVAERFEVYYRGIELANGFHELEDPAEQRRRFEEDNKQRMRKGLETMPMDDDFLSALESGLPACSGVALGVDRLLMLALNKNHINDVLAFSHA